MYCVYRMYDKTLRLLYIGHSESPSGRFYEHSDKQPFWFDVCTITLEYYPTYEDMRRAEELAIQDEEPVHNRIRYENVAHLDPLPLPTYDGNTLPVIPKRKKNTCKTPKPRRPSFNDPAEKARIRQKLITEGRLTYTKP